MNCYSSNTGGSLRRKVWEGEIERMRWNARSEGSRGGDG